MTYGLEVRCSIQLSYRCSSAKYAKAIQKIKSAFACFESFVNIAGQFELSH
jgi:hypothetical protein